MELLETLPRVCTVPEVQSELRAGIESYPYLQRALDSLGDAIPVIALDESVDEAATELETRLDLGEARAFAIADIYDGTLVTDTVVRDCFRHRSATVLVSRSETRRERVHGGK